MSATADETQWWFKRGGDGVVYDIPAQQFSKDNDLHSFEFDESFKELTCPGCEASFEPPNLGAAVDWALGHECEGSDE